MTIPTNIFGKVGKYVGEEIKEVHLSIASVRASIASAVGGIDIQNLNGPVSIHGDLKVSNDVSIGGDISLAGSLTALGQLAALRAQTVQDVEVGTNLHVKGNAIFDGDVTMISSNSISTTTIETSDNIIELNKSSDGSVTAPLSGIEINTGETSTTTGVGGTPFAAGSASVTLYPLSTSSSSTFTVGPDTFDLVIPPQDTTTGANTTVTFQHINSWNNGQPYYTAKPYGSTNYPQYKLQWEENINSYSTSASGGWKLYYLPSSGSYQLYVVNSGGTAHDICVPWFTNDTLSAGEILPLPLSQTSTDTLMSSAGNPINGSSASSATTFECTVDDSNYPNSTGTWTETLGGGGNVDQYPYLYSMSIGAYEEIQTDSYAGGTTALWATPITASGIFSVSAAYGASDFTDPGNPILRGDLKHAFYSVGLDGTGVFGNNGMDADSVETSMVS